jgi:hypothetical protein
MRRIRGGEREMEVCSEKCIEESSHNILIQHHLGRWVFLSNRVSTEVSMLSVHIIIYIYLVPKRSVFQD